MEDSPTYLNLESTQDTTELISLKPSHISIGSNVKIKQPIRTQKPTPVPVKPTPFPPLKETFIQDTHEHIQPTEQATKPPVMNPNTNSLRQQTHIPIPSIKKSELFPEKCPVL